MIVRSALVILCGVLVCLSAAQPVADSSTKVRFGGPANDPTASGIRVDVEFNENEQLGETRWGRGWFKRAGADVAFPLTHLLVYMHTESCRKYVSFFNRTCIDKVETKALFFPRIDHMSRLEINNSFLTYSNDTEFQIWLSVKNGTVDWVDPATNQTVKNNTFAVTTKKHYTDPRALYVVGAYTAFITMEKGLPSKIEWEEGCDECFKWCGACRSVSSLSPSQQATTTSSSGSAAADIDCGTADTSVNQGEYRPYDRDCNPGRCIDNMCAVSRNFECANSTNCIGCDDQTCNLKVYIGWKGTDAVGRVLTSFGSVPSVFRKFSFSPSYRQAVGIFTRQETFLLVGG